MKSIELSSNAKPNDEHAHPRAIRVNACEWRSQGQLRIATTSIQFAIGTATEPDSCHPHHDGGEFKIFIPLNEHRTTRTRRVRIAIGEPEVLISRQQVAPKVTGQHVPSISGIRCMHERNVGALNFGTIDFQGGMLLRSSFSTISTTSRKKARRGTS